MTEVGSKDVDGLGNNSVFFFIVGNDIKRLFNKHPNPILHTVIAFNGMLGDQKVWRMLEEIPRVLKVLHTHQWLGNKKGNDT